MDESVTRLRLSRLTEAVWPIVAWALALAALCTLASSAVEYLSVDGLAGSERFWVFVANLPSQIALLALGAVILASFARTDERLTFPRRLAVFVAAVVCVLAAADIIHTVFTSGPLGGRVTYPWRARVAEVLQAVALFLVAGAAVVVGRGADQPATT